MDAKSLRGECALSGIPTRFLILGRSRNLGSLDDSDFGEAKLIASTLMKMLPHERWRAEKFRIEADQRRLTRERFDELRQWMKETQQQRRLANATKRRSK